MWKKQGILDIIQNSFHKLDESSLAKILGKITAVMAAFARSKNNDNNAKDRIFDIFGEIGESIQEDFKEVVGISNDKKAFVRALAKIFLLLLNTNVNTIGRIRKIVEIAIEKTLKIWQELRQ